MKCLSCQRAVSGREFCEDCLTPILPRAHRLRPEAQEAAEASAPEPLAEPVSVAPPRTWKASGWMGAVLALGLGVGLLTGPISSLTQGVSMQASGPGSARCQQICGASALCPGPAAQATVQEARQLACGCRVRVAYCCFNANYNR